MSSILTLEGALEKPTLHCRSSFCNTSHCRSGAHDRADDGNFEPDDQCHRGADGDNGARSTSDRNIVAARRRSNRNYDRHRHDDHRNHHEWRRRWPLGLARFARSLRSLRSARRFFYDDNLRSALVNLVELNVWQTCSRISRSDFNVH